MLRLCVNAYRCDAASGECSYTGARDRGRGREGERERVCVIEREREREREVQTDREAGVERGVYIEREGERDGNDFDPSTCSGATSTRTAATLPRGNAPTRVRRRHETEGPYVCLCV